MNINKRRMLIEAFVATCLIIMTGSGCFLWGCSYTQHEEHYRLHAAQLTANDIPIWFEDEVPGMAGTKEKPVLCGAYYDSTKQSVILFTVKQ